MKDSSEKSPLLPDRHPTPDFFVCDIFDAAPKGDMASMEHPIFSLSTKPDNRVRRYEHNGKYIEIKPGTEGLATIHDRDILIYCISQLISAINSGKQVSRNLRFKAYDLLTATNRQTDGRGYIGLKAAIERLRGTSISTNIITGGKETFEVFGLIDYAKIVKLSRDGRMQEVEIGLADWVYNAVQAQEVLTLNRDYFRLRKPIERRMYEIARKHCGRKTFWKISLELLRKKCGASSNLKEFRRLVSNIAKEDENFNHIPDYSIRLIECDMVEFCNRNTMPENVQISNEARIHLKTDTYHDARLEAPGWDIYELEREWREWMTEPPRNPDAAFIGFCRKVYQKRGSP